jgi:hypothetical protein
MASDERGEQLRQPAAARCAARSIMTVGHVRYNPHYSPVAQSVERLTVNQEVAGSSPARGANYFEDF